MTNGKGRKPRRRAPRSQTARKAALEAGSASKARGLIKRRMASLEARMAILERFLESINSPEAQAYADDMVTQAHVLSDESWRGKDGLSAEEE